MQNCFQAIAEIARVLVAFRKRLSIDIIAEANECIINSKEGQDDSDNDDDDNTSSPQQASNDNDSSTTDNKGTMLLVHPPTSSIPKISSF